MTPAKSSQPKMFHSIIVSFAGKNCAPDALVDHNREVYQEVEEYQGQPEPATLEFELR